MFFRKKEKVAEDRIQVNTSTITTFVGEDTYVEGLLKTKASLRVDGEVHGDIRCDGVVILTKSGKVTGTIEAENIIVAGEVQGNMSIRDKVNVESTGRIFGEIITKKFVIAEESIFQGNCIMNLEGEYIPVTPYKTEAEKEAEKALEEEKKEEPAVEKEPAKNSKASKKSSRADKRKKSSASKTETKEADKDLEKESKTEEKVADKDSKSAENSKKTDVKEADNSDKEKETKSEEKAGEAFAKELSELADDFVCDAFGSAHRAHASVSVVTKFIKEKGGTNAVGYLMQKEIDFLGNAVENPVRPFVAILGGAKVADKLNVIDNLLEKADTLIIGGGMAFTFLKAQGYETV